ncbi:MAG TPA: S8 family peptidase [Polyangiaceae bacterium]
MSHSIRLSRAIVFAATGAAASFSLVACSAKDTDSTVEDTASTTSALTASEIPTVTPDRYIVVLKQGAAVTSDTVPSVAAAMEQQYGGKVVSTYRYALKGFAMDIPASALSQVKADSRVAYVEPDYIAQVVDTQIGPPNWGLDRIDQRNLPLNYTYAYPHQAGAGVHAYVIDTGIYAAHPDFGGRVIPGVDFVDNDANPDDDHGHGTHVAGIIGSATYGVAKQVTLHSIRVCYNFFGFGLCSDSAILNAIDYVTNNHIDPAVVNMSIGGPLSLAENQAIQNSIAAGVTYVVAAGNNDQDACNYSPSSTPNAITVGATGYFDAAGSYTFDVRGRLSDGTFYSNYGSCLDLFAPGTEIVSTYLGGGTYSMTGTSQASPHVAGAAALYLGAHPTASPAQVASTLVAQATPNVIQDVGPGSPNRLLYTGFMNAASNPCADICPNPISFAWSGSYQSGALGTGVVCRETTQNVVGGNCGNFTGGRTLSVNGVVMPCNNLNWSSIPAKRNGGYCISTTAGNYSWAFFTLW